MSARPTPSWILFAIQGCICAALCYFLLARAPGQLVDSSPVVAAKIVKPVKPAVTTHAPVETYSRIEPSAVMIEGAKRSAGRMTAESLTEYPPAIADPEYRKLLIDDYLDRYGVRYASLLRGMNCGGEKTQQVLSALVQKQLISLEYNDGFHSADPQTRDAARRAVDSARADIDAQLQSEIGPDAFATYRAYFAAPDVLRNAVTDVVSGLTGDDTLTSAQEASIYKILKDAVESEEPGAVDVRTGKSSDWLQARVKAVLTPSQWDQVGQEVVVQRSSAPGWKPRK